MDEDNFGRKTIVKLRYIKNFEKDLQESYFKVVDGKCPKNPYNFQMKAYRRLNNFFDMKSNKKGLLILPTGARKTFTAISWILKNIVDKNIKIIWVAHRHELLDQVKNEMKTYLFKYIGK